MNGVKGGIEYAKISAYGMAEKTDEHRENKYALNISTANKICSPKWTCIILAMLYYSFGRSIISPCCFSLLSIIYTLIQEQKSKKAKSREQLSFFQLA